MKITTGLRRVCAALVASILLSCSSRHESDRISHFRKNLPERCMKNAQYFPKMPGYYSRLGEDSIIELEGDKTLYKPVNFLDKNLDKNIIFFEKGNGVKVLIEGFLGRDNFCWEYNRRPILFIISMERDM